MFRQVSAVVLDDADEQQREPAELDVRAADEALVALLQRDQLVYGGYSAGACVLGSDLIELQLVDDLTAVDDPVTSGLGLLDRPLVPHVH